MDALAVMDFGSQYSQLITRRVREASVYCELFPHDAPAEQVLSLNPKGFILSGGPASVYAPGAPQIPAYILESGKPILGICYGMQALTHALGGSVAPAPEREYGHANVTVKKASTLLPEGERAVWMSHGDRIEKAPAGFQVLAESANSPIAAMADEVRGFYCLQFHPEVNHTQGGDEILHSFALDVCQAEPTWTPESIIDQSIAAIRDQVGEGNAIAGVSGGVDSSVAAALVHRAIGDQLTCIFVDTGLLRADEAELVRGTFEQDIGAALVTVDAADSFFEVLRSVTDPETKRRRIGERFIRIFEAEAQHIGPVQFLVQGTIYPDVVESSGPERQQAARIKTHHNVGGLPPDLELELVEPLRFLFKDEVRQVGLALGLREELVWRQPFPGPGLAVRCLGTVSPDRVQRLRSADKIVREELKLAQSFQQAPGKPGAEKVAQAFAVLLPVQSVGVMGDERTYAETVVVRAVSTEDFMTADWARLPHELLGRISSRIVNEVEGINRVVYDITSKPPATIEWE
ncbi:MAG: glutamine-hydrolyzing GMP synthase [Anaerolineales bacterium]